MHVLVETSIYVAANMIPTEESACYVLYSYSGKLKVYFT